MLEHALFALFGRIFFKPEIFDPIFFGVFDSMDLDGTFWVRFFVMKNLGPGSLLLS